jgi:hypothetical protein
VTTGARDVMWEPLVQHGTEWCAPNITADARWVDDGVTQWRVSRTRLRTRNCYVVSATGQYLDYGRDEIRRLDSSMLRAATRAALIPLAPILRALDPIVVLDALPVSTVLHSTHTAADWVRALRAVRAQFPRDTVVVRSLDTRTNSAALAALQSAGLTLVPSRLVYHQDPRVQNLWRLRNVHHDLRLHEREPLSVRPLVAADASRSAELYWQLYGAKHSTLNPQFTSEWLAHCIANGALQGEGIEVDGTLAAVYLSYTVADWMTNPIFGYDTSLPQSLGLYRRLSLLTLLRARDRGLAVHASSGAPNFKASRGGVPTIEYHAVDTRGSARGTQLAWWLTRSAAMHLGPRLLSSAR